MRKKFLLVVMMVVAACGMSHAKNPVSSVSQLNSPEYTIGTDVGGEMLKAAEAAFPQARKEYFSDKIGGYAALVSRKVDALIENRYEADYDIKHGLGGVKILPGTLGESVKISAGLSKVSKIPGLEEKFNSFIARAKSEGLIDSMIQRWVYGNAEMPDIDVPAKSDVRVVLGTTGLVVPFSFYAGDKVTGLDVELARRFAASIGAELEIRVYHFGGLLMALSTGEVDIALSNLYYSQEREISGSLTFSDVLYTVEPVALVRDDMYSPSDTGKFSAFSGKRIGVFTGSVQYDMVRKNIPGAEIAYFDAIANVMNELTSGKIAAAAVDETIAADFERANPGLTHIPEALGSAETAFLFPKSNRNNPLLDDMNEYLRRAESDGTLSRLRAVWSGTDESEKVIPDYSGLPATKGTIRIAIDSETPLFAYLKEGRVVGYDVDVIVRFCKEKGYKPDFIITNFPGIIPAVSSGKCDMGAGGITVTPERAESVRFSEPLYPVSSYLVVKKSASSQPVATKPATSQPAAKSEAAARVPKYSRLSELDGKPIGVQTGTYEWARFVNNILPHSQVVYYNTFADIIAALKSHKIEAFLVDEPVYNLMAAEDASLARIDAKIDEAYDIAYGFPKTDRGRKLCDEMSEYIRRIRESGELASIIAKWEGTDENAKTLPDYKNLPATNGVITMATEGEYPPFNYYRGREIAGNEIDIAARFCEAYGYGLKVTAMSWEAIIPALASGKYDFAGAALDVSEEHSELIYFSEPYAKSRSVMACLRSDSKPEPAKSDASPRVPKYSRTSELDGKPIGMQPGIIDWEEWAAKNLPHSKVHYYTAYPDLASALKTHKIEGFLVDSPVLALMAAEDDALTAIDEIVGDPFGYSFVYAKTERGRKLCDEMSDYLRGIKASGELDAVLSKWQGSDEAAKIPPDYKSLPAKNGTLTFATEGGYPPFSYYKGTKLAGIDLELAVMFCEAHGYGLNVQTMTWDAMLPSVFSGKADFAGDFTPSDEHGEAVYFSEPYCMAHSVMACLKDESQTVSRSPSVKLSDLDGKPVGLQVGVPALETFVRKFLPHSEIHYYNTYTDIAAAVKSGKVASFIVDTPVLALMSMEDTRLSAVDEIIDDGYDVAYGFPKTEAGRKLCDEMSEYIRRIKSSGELQALIERWTGADESAKVAPDYKNFPAPKGVLRMATEGEYAPMNYFKGKDFAGIDIDLAARFCKANGYGLEIIAMSCGAIVPAVASGKFDFAGADLNPTPENVEVLNFSEPYYRSSHVVAYLKTDSQKKSPETGSLAGKIIGVQTGTTCAELVPEKIPSAKLAYYDSLTDELAALKAGKVDAICCSLPAAIFAENEDSRLARINPPLRETYLYPVFADTEKGRKLCAEYSAFLKTLWDNGTIDALNDKWLGADDSRKTVEDYSQLPATNGTIKMAVDASMLPFVYVRDNRIVGYDIDLAVIFCKAKGYALEVENMTFTGVISSVKTGKCDFTQSMNKTPEREENTLFTSTPAIKSGNVLVALKSQELDTRGISGLKVSDFEGKKVGLLIGSDSAKKIEDKIPGVNILFFDSPSHILPSLRSGRIDAFYCALPTAKNIIHTYDDLAYIPEYVNTTRHTAMFPKTDKGRKLCDEYADFLKTLSADGTLDSLTEKWITGTDESKQVTEDYANLPAANGTLTMAVTEGLMPFVFVKDNRIQGFDIDLAVLFCKHKGCGLNIEVMNHNGVLSSLQTGKCDFTYSVQWTEERDKTVLFSPVPNAVTGSVLVVMRDEDTRSVRMDLADFSGKKIGVPTATSNAEIVAEVLPEAKLVYFDSPAEMLPALRQGKIDAFSCALPTILFLLHENKDVQYVSEPLKKSYHSAIFTPSEKGRKLRDEYSAFLKKLWDDGTIDELFSKWFKEGEEARQTEDYSSLPAVKGTLRMAVDTGMIPFVYVKDNRIQGYDIDLAVMFCKAEGWGLELVPISRLGALEAVKSGKCDFSYAMAETEERSKSVVFASVPNSRNDNVLVVMKPAAPVQPTKPADDESSFWDDIASSFGKTFIREDRWKLFIEGIMNTMIITVAAIFCGILLGFTAFMFCRTGSAVANIITKFSVWLIKGTPIVVLLMILYYIIFGHVNISGILVSIIAFTLTFGTSVYRMLTFGTGAVDYGQTEAAYALGFTDLQTFFTVILPQAAIHFMPSLKEEVTMLIKSTSVVGYIAVQDLTKMGDIVRSRTYEAFFPLIAVAAIYFVLAGILNLITAAAERRVNPTRRKPEDILRGIKTEGDPEND